MRQLHRLLPRGRVLPRPDKSFGHLKKILQDCELSLGLGSSWRDFPLAWSMVRAQTAALLCDLGASLGPRSISGGSDGEESACNAEDLGSIPGSGRFPWRREWLHTPVFLLEKIS